MKKLKHILLNKSILLVCMIYTFVLSGLVFSQADPLAPAVGVVEDGVDVVSSVTVNIIWIMIAGGFMFAIYNFVTGNIKMGFVVIGSTAVVGSIIMAIINTL